MLYAWQKDRKEVVRIRVIENPLASYFNYEFDWGYIPSALHAQKVFSSRKKGLNKFVKIKYFPTFGFFNDEIVFKPLYDKRGSFLGNREILSNNYSTILDNGNSNSSYRHRYFDVFIDWKCYSLAFELYLVIRFEYSKTFLTLPFLSLSRLRQCPLPNARTSADEKYRRLCSSFGYSSHIHS